MIFVRDMSCDFRDSMKSRLFIEFQNTIVYWVNDHDGFKNAMRK